MAGVGVSASTRMVPVVSNGGVLEWSLLELQGDLETLESSVDGHPIGTFLVEGSTPHLVVGVHRLEGKFVTLPKPFIVLQREAQNGADTASFLVAGVVRQKALFKLRPKVVIPP
ncbi:chromosome transmission fidelity protein 8 [Pelagophyceae sp. CCMP2097]|nr:chromosome transmission fidelity protein 8 [Pelagophyceae sp. CCMP2097]